MRSRRERARAKKEACLFEKEDTFPNVIELRPDTAPRTIVSVIPVPRSNIPLIILAYGLAIEVLCINAVMAWDRGSTTKDKIVLSILFFTLEAIVFFLPAWSKTLWQTRQYVPCIICVVVWLPLFGFAIYNSQGFASTNYAETTTLRAERITPAVSDAQRRLDTLSASRRDECLKRGDRCRQLEREEQSAIEGLREAREKVTAIADPQIASAAKLIAWVSLDRFHPSADDFAMLRLLLLTLLPQLGGLVLMVAKRT